MILQDLIKDITQDLNVFIAKILEIFVKAY